MSHKVALDRNIGYSAQIVLTQDQKRSGASFKKRGAGRSYGPPI